MILPIVMLCLSLILMKFYKLDSQTMVEVQEKIQVMKAAKDQESAIAIAENVLLSDLKYVDLNDYKIEDENKK